MRAPGRSSASTPCHSALKKTPPKSKKKRPFGENGLIDGPAQKMPLGPDGSMELGRVKTLTVGGRVTGVMFVRIVDEELGGEGENANDHKRSFVIF